MKIAFITTSDLSCNAGQTRAHQIIITRKALALAQLGHKVYIITESPYEYFEVDFGYFIKRSFPRWSYLFHRTLQQIIERILLTREMPPEERPNFHSPFDIGMLFRVTYLCLLKKFDVFQAEKISYVYPALLAKLLFRVPIVCVEHDIEYQRLNEICALTPRCRDFITRLERYACQKSDAVVTVSQVDKQRLIDIGIKALKIFVIPHGLDVTHYQDNNPERVRHKYRLKGTVIVFHGTFSYQPNAMALRFILREFLPLMRARKIESRFLIVGGDNPKNIKEKDVIFTGAIDNSELPDYLAAADFAVVPIRTGGGTRIKIIEYFACGVPVISTTKGAEGIPVKDGRELLIAETATEMADCICSLIKDKERRDSLVRNAYRFVQKLDWMKISEQYVKLYSNKLTA